MLEIIMSGLMSGDGKRSGLLGAQPPRPSSTLLIRTSPDSPIGRCSALIVVARYR